MTFKVYDLNMEHDACGVGLVASTEGKKSRKIVEFDAKGVLLTFPLALK